MKVVSNENETTVTKSDEGRSLGRLMAREVSLEEITMVAGAANTGSHWPYPTNPGDTDVAL